MNTKPSSAEAKEPAASQLPAAGDSLASRAKAVIPGPVREALRPLAAKVGLASATGPATQDAPDVLMELTRPSVNPWTINVRGRERRFFFLCGCWRSGTHWVARVLNLHPKMSIVGEFHFDHMLAALGRFTATDGGVGAWYQAHKPYLNTIAAESMQTLIRRTVYAAAHRKRTALWLGDHSPRPLAEALPGAPNILVVRDGRDVLVSQAFHSLRARRIDWFRPAFRKFAGKYIAEFQQNPEGFKNSTRGFLSEPVWVRSQARDWAKKVHKDLEAMRRLRREGTPVHLVRYEDMHQDFDRQREALYRFFGVDPADAEAPSQESKTLPGFKAETLTSDNRKGIVGDWGNYFNDRIAEDFRREAGEALVELGYEAGPNW